jgi:hypothetical protein
MARIALMQACIGIFTSATASQALIADHIFFGMIFWSFVPLLQVGATAVVLRLVTSARRQVVLLAAHSAKNGPFHLLLLAIAGWFALSSDLETSFFSALRTGILPIAIVATFGWATMLSFWFYRALDVPRWRAARLTLVDVLLKSAMVVGYYIAIGNLLPVSLGVGS